MISSGCAACPDPETTYLGFGCSEGLSDAAEMPREDGGRVDGIVL